jgi:hypothetical protein
MALARCLLLMLLPVLATAAQADPIGQIKVLSGEVYIERAGVRTAAALGVAVNQSDRIITGKDGSVGVSFADQALLSAGPNTSLVLDQFNYDPATRQGSFDVSLRRGTLSAIAGKIVAQTPGAMKVRTPAAVLAVRGTEFVVHVEAPQE